MIRILSLFCMMSSALYGANFHHRMNHYGGGNICRLKVVGERCSGTHYVTHLIHRNIWDLEPTGSTEFGHKHFLWCCGAPVDEEMLTMLGYDLDAVDFHGSDDCLFVVVVRDPYEWAQSFHATSGSMQEFADFASQTWVPTESQYRCLEDCNPWTGKPFRNLFDLRKYKLINYLNLRKCVKNYVLVRYEDVRDDPRGFIDYIAKHYCLHRAEKFVSAEGIDEVLGAPMKEAEIALINQEIDKEIESAIGYCVD